MLVHEISRKVKDFQSSRRLHERDIKIQKTTYITKKKTISMRLRNPNKTLSNNILLHVHVVHLDTANGKETRNNPTQNGIGKLQRSL